MSETLKLRFDKKKWIAEKDDDGLHWGIYYCTLGDQQITIKGRLEPEMFQQDLEFQVTGRWVNDQKYGKQFEFQSYTLVQPSGKWGTIAFLCQASGIGETTATEIWNNLGEGVHKLLVEDPETVIAKCGFGGHRAQIIRAASEILGKTIGDMELKMPLLSLFKGTKIAGERTAKAILAMKMPNAVERIKANPFILMDLPGIAFKQCDSLRIKLKHPKDMPARIQAACRQVFTDESDQTWLIENDIRVVMQNLLEMKCESISEWIEKLVEDSIIVKVCVNDVNMYALHSHYAYEKIVAEQIHLRLNMPGDKWPIDEIRNDRDLSQHQKDVLVHNMLHGGRLITLTGSPGTGKTFSLGKVIEHFRRKNPNDEVYAAAPTGKAAQRLTQSLSGGLVATTVHKMLEPVPVSDGWAFKRNETNPIPEDMVSLDESSMVNNWLGAHALSALPRDCYLIITGDKNQLPPVGPGTMLRDLEELPNFRELTEIRRNSGKAVQVCAAIRDGASFNIASHPVNVIGKDITPDTNIRMLVAHRDESKASKIETMVDNILAGQFEGISDPLEDVQFITATHRNPHVGRLAMNEMLQRKFNPTMKGEHKHFKVGDKIICTENTLIKNEDEFENKREFIANGELGYVVESHKKYIVVKMNSYPKALFRVPCGEGVGNGWDLGYCITCHKYQGSECPIVVTIIGDDYGTDLVVCREWAYTAFSRHKFLSIVVSTPTAVKRHVRKIRIWDRRSMILNYLEELGNVSGQCSNRSETATV